MTYTHLSAGAFHTVLLRSDGAAVACGINEEGQCKIPSQASWRELLSFSPVSRRYICHDLTIRVHDPVRVLQLDFVCQDETFLLTCSSLAGHEVLRFEASGSALALDAYREIAQKLDANLCSIQVVLPNGKLLASVYKANPFATLSDLAKTL